MARRQVSYTHQLNQTLETLTRGGLLLVSTKRDGTSNVMTIGWAAVGVIWGLPVMVVMVRPSRYTYGFIEDSGLFSVNVPTAAMRPYVDLCGTKSGREVDKLVGVAVSMGQEVECTVLDDCSLVYECSVVHTNEVQHDKLTSGIVQRAYARGDFHRMYYGQILGTFAE